MDKPVRVRNAPGLAWKKRRNGYEARWQCRTDIAAKGFLPKSMQLWSGSGEPTKEEWDYIADICAQLQQEMLVFGRGGVPASIVFDGTLASLMQSYRTDPDSNFRKIRYTSRVYYEALIRLIDQDHGIEPLSEIKARTFLRWHEKWGEGGKASVAHAKIGMLRTLLGFGASILEDAECQRLSSVLSKMRFPMAKPRSERLTAEQATLIRNKAHEMGRHSIALAQAFQFELMLRQKDVIGEWVPMTEPGLSEVTDRGFKWLGGIRWEEIDQNLILKHVTSKRQKEIVVNLRNAPMVMEELERLGDRPVSGPIVVCDRLPWDTAYFRRCWRDIANECGIPKTVRNMDSRAGAISEATDAGADLEHVRHAATHSNISMTQRYSRGAEEKIANVQKLRVQSRKTKSERND